MTDSNARGPRALDVDADAELNPLDPDAYRENDDYRPDPLFQYGTLDTSDTAGGAHQDIRETSPVFAEARAETLRTAVRALDPDDDTPEELVILPEGSVTITGTAKTADEAREDIARAFTKVAENPIGVGTNSTAAKAAAETRDTPDSDQDGVPDDQERSSDRANPAGARNEGTSKAATTARRTGVSKN